MSEFDEVDFTSVPDGKRKRKRATSVPDSKTKWSQKGKKPSLSLSVFGITVSEEDRDIFTTSTVLRNWYSIPRSKVSSAQLNMIQKVKDIYCSLIQKGSDHFTTLQGLYYAKG